MIKVQNNYRRRRTIRQLTHQCVLNVIIIYVVILYGSQNPHKTVGMLHFILKTRFKLKEDYLQTVQVLFEERHNMPSSALVECQKRLILEWFTQRRLALHENMLDKCLSVYFSAPIFILCINAHSILMTESNTLFMALNIVLWLSKFGVCFPSHCLYKQICSPQHWC